MLSYLPGGAPFDVWKSHIAVASAPAPAPALITPAASKPSPVLAATAPPTTTNPIASGLRFSTIGAGGLNVLTRQDSVPAAVAKEWGPAVQPSVSPTHGRILPSSKNHKNHLSRISITEFYKKRGSQLNLKTGSALLSGPTVLDVLCQFVPLSSTVLRIAMEYLNGTGRIVMFAGHTYSADNDLRLNVDFSDKVYVLSCLDRVRCTYTDLIVLLPRAVKRTILQPVSGRFLRCRRPCDGLRHITSDTAMMQRLLYTADVFMWSAAADNPCLLQTAMLQ